MQKNLQYIYLNFNVDAIFAVSFGSGDEKSTITLKSLF